tara:strand:- start:351 stop:746 length:396 start_codon:yes stop_codon:yes gene_type:complete
MLLLIKIIIIGMISGFASGALGLTAAPSLVPMLVLFSVVNSYKTAIGTTLFAVLPPLSIGAAITYYKHKNIDVKTGLILMLIIAIASYFGSLFTVDANPQTIALITSGILFLLSGFWFYCGLTGKYISKSK